MNGEEVNEYWIKYYLEDIEWMKSEWLQHEKFICSIVESRESRINMMYYTELHKRQEVKSLAYEWSNSNNTLAMMSFPTSMKIHAQTINIDDFNR